MDFAIILGLITLVGWGTGDLFTIVSTRRIGANLTTFWVFFFSFILALLFYPYAPHDFSGITTTLLIFNIFLGILFVSGNVLISEAFRLSSAPLVGIIIQSFPAVVLLLSVVIFKDVITTKQLVHISIVFLGVILCSVDFKKLRESKTLIDKGMALALLAMVFLSIFFTFSRVLINAYGWYLPSLIATACFPVILLFIKKRKEKFVFPRERLVIFACFMVGLLIRSGDFALNWGLSIPNGSSVVAPIAAAAPILFVIMSYFIFKDKLTRQQMFGIVIALVGIVLLTTLGQK